MSLRLRRRRRDELGAVAILMAVLAMVICMFAAYAVDIGLQVNRKHMLNDTLDAAAQAGAFALPSSSDAEIQALAFAKAHDPTEDGSLKPNVDFWCVVASKLTGGSYGVDTTQIPATCNPGATPYPVGVNYKTTGRKTSCSAVLCAIPCVQPTPNNGSPKIACNTIRVFQGRDVPFAFAPAGGIDKGGTGNLISVACKGSCGTVAPNPMDVAVVADRTESMQTTDVSAMISGIKGMLQQMTPSQQYVSLGTIGRSGASSTGQSGSCTSGQLTYPSSSVTTGKFVPVSFSNNYVDGSGALQSSSTLVKGVDCLTNRSPKATGTSLAAPMKAAARYLLGTDANNLSSLPVRTDPVTKVIIFETDGQPNERISYTAANQFNRAIGSTSLTTPDEPFSSQMSLDTNGVSKTLADTSQDASTGTNKVTRTITHNKTITYKYNGGARACQNLIDVATNAKAAGIKVIMIAYNMTGNKCYDWDGWAACETSPCQGGVDGYDDRGDYTASSTTVNGPEADSVGTEKQCNAQGKNCVTVTVTKKYRTTTTTKHEDITAAESPDVLNVMAQAASPNNGVSSVANSNCSTDALRTAENSDGDYFFCAASGTQMAPIFRTALSQVSKGIKLIKMP